MEIKYRLCFRGDFADRNRLPAHEGAASIEGMAWAFSLLANYAASGQIRKRGAMDHRLKLFMLPAKRGSFIAEIIAVANDPSSLFIAGAVGLGGAAAIANAVGSLFDRNLRR